MFFRREKPRQWTFEDRIAALKQLGFECTREPSGAVHVTRGGCAALVADQGEGRVALGKSGVLAGDEIAVLVHGGYQMFFRTPGGRELPALAFQLKALHTFDQDLREALGLTSLYNTSLGTTCPDHLYDRLHGR
jgi:hypothetical protein